MINKLALILLIPCGAACAQVLDATMMPDGSKDMYVGAALGAGPRDGQSGRRETRLSPLLQVQWSNGLFLSGFGTLGLHLARAPDFEYGPMLSWQAGRSPSDAGQLAGSEKIRPGLNAGGFFNYYAGDRLRLTTSALYLPQAHGLLVNTGLQKTLPEIAPHHTLTLSLGVTGADGAVARQRYGVAQATAAAPRYVPAGGLLSAQAGVNWNWSLSSRWIVTGGASATVLAPAAADSPLVDRRAFIRYGTGLAYRF